MAAPTLSPETISIVKATAPVMAEHGYTITRTMYEHLFCEHPELREVFNQVLLISFGFYFFSLEKLHAMNLILFFSPSLASHPLFSTDSQTHQVERKESRAHQPASLAAAVHAYAANIDNLGVLTEAVERIAQKHVSLGITPAQYNVVGECVRRKSPPLILLLISSQVLSSLAASSSGERSSW